MVVWFQKSTRSGQLNWQGPLFPTMKTTPNIDRTTPGRRKNLEKAKRGFFRPRDVAGQLGVMRSHVSCLITKGALCAKNIATPRARRPTYRIAPSDLIAFVDQTEVVQAKPTPRGRRPRVSEGVEEFF